VKCNRCGKPARHIIYHTANSKNEVLLLCDECFVAGGFVKLAPGARLAAKASNVFCPRCNTRLNEFLQSGYLGCPACYVAFAKEIQEIIPKIQVIEEVNGRAVIRHKGKRLTKTQTASAIPVQLTNEQKIELLKMDMNRASKEQRFADAQRYYQEIIKLGGSV